MSLSGSQLGALADIVVAGWERRALKILVHIKFDQKIEDVVNTDAGWYAVVFEFLDALNRDERVPEFARVLFEDKPTIPALGSFCRDLAAGGHGPPPDALRRAIDGFNEEFRDDLFKHLNAYKELHDVLHLLQRLMGSVARDVEARIADPTNPLAQGVEDLLTDSLSRAGKYAPRIEVPDNPPKWIAKLKTAVSEFTAEPADAGRMSVQLKRLRLMPAEGLAPLNDRLVDVAKKLKPRNLIDALDQILAVLGDDPDSARRQLRADALTFRGLCVELDDLSTAHDLCQTIDDALREAPGLEAVTVTSLTDWKEAREALDELVERKPTDDLIVRRVRRTADAARLFESANQADKFKAFVDLFDDLFLKTDQTLLRVTTDLTHQATTLQAALKKVLEKAP